MHQERLRALRAQSDAGVLCLLMAAGRTTEGPGCHDGFVGVSLGIGASGTVVPAVASWTGELVGVSRKFQKHKQD